MKKTTTFLALIAAGLVLTACGSGADTASAPVAPVAAPQAAATPAPSSAAPSAADANRTAPVSDPGAEIDADDQSGDGSSVVVRVARITLGPGWVAVRTDDDNGSRLLGSAAVAPGQDGPVTVTLTEPVPAGEDDDDLTVVLHADDGNGVFDEQVDPRILDDDDDDDDGDQYDDDIEDDDLDYRLN